MPHPLKPELLPLEQHLLPDLPTIVGNVDYQTLRAQLLRMQSDSNDPQNEALQYDNAGRLINATLTDTTTSALLHQYAYTYDPVGNRLSEQIDGQVTNATYNDLNQLTGTHAGGSMVFSGTVSKYAHVTVSGNPALLDTNNHFRGTAQVTTGTNNVPVIAQDVDGNVTTNNYQVVVPPGNSSTPTYDLNGNTTNDGQGKTFEWDAKNELTAINYATPVQQKMTGAIIGTPGSYHNNGNVIAQVFDNNGATYFDSPNASGSWVGLDLGSAPAPVSQIKYVCRAAYGSRMVGGIFQASRTADFSSGVVTLATISTTPSSGVPAQQAFLGSQGGSIYLGTELPALLANPAVTTIEITF